MSDVKKLSDVLNAAPSLSEVGGFLSLLADSNGELAKMPAQSLTGLSAKVIDNGDYLAKDTGVYLLIAVSQDNPWAEYWVGILINQNRDAKGCQHCIRIASNTLNVDYNQWGSFFAKGSTSKAVYVLITIRSTPELLGGVNG